MVYNISHSKRIYTLKIIKYLQYQRQETLKKYLQKNYVFDL
jgi:hypothetical protein